MPVPIHFEEIAPKLFHTQVRTQYCICAEYRLGLLLDSCLWFPLRFHIIERLVLHSCWLKLSFCLDSTLCFRHYNTFVWNCIIGRLFVDAPCMRLPFSLSILLRMCWNESSFHNRYCSPPTVVDVYTSHRIQTDSQHVGCILSFMYPFCYNKRFRTLSMTAVPYTPHPTNIGPIS